MKSEWAFKTKDTGEHMKKTPSALLVGAVVAVLAVLALLVAPVAARATSLSVRQRSEAEVEELVEGMLSAGDYVEGEALVCYLPDAEGLTAQAGGPLAGAEVLSSVTARQFAEATGEALPAASGHDVLTAQAEEEPVQVLLVRSDELGTAELLRELLADSRVLSAEPNYLMSFAEDGGDQVVDDVAVLAGETADDSADDPFGGSGVRDRDAYRRDGNCRQDLGQVGGGASK